MFDGQNIVPSGKLTLKHYEMPYNTTTGSMTNSVGISTNFNTSCTWTGLNIRACVGELYDKYDRFNLVLSSVSMPWRAAATTYGATTGDTVVHMYLSGLSLLGQGYDSALKTNSCSTFIGSMYFPSSSNFGCRGQICPIVTTFAKPTDFVDITINLYKNADGSVPVGGVRPWMLFFDFDIYGIVTEEP